jgi:hypothetical protein
VLVLANVLPVLGLTIRSNSAIPLAIAKAFKETVLENIRYKIKLNNQ